MLSFGSARSWCSLTSQAGLRNAWGVRRIAAKSRARCWQLDGRCRWHVDASDAAAASENDSLKQSACRTRLESHCYRLGSRRIITGGVTRNRTFATTSKQRASLSCGLPSILGCKAGGVSPLITTRTRAIAQRNRRLASYESVRRAAAARTPGGGATPRLGSSCTPSTRRLRAGPGTHSSIYKSTGKPRIASSRRGQP